MTIYWVRFNSKLQELLIDCVTRSFQGSGTKN